MALLPILHYPDPRLRTRAKPVGTVDASVRKLIDDLLETMYDAPGIGLSATQVNVHKRVIVVDVSEGRDQPNVFVNPSIVRSEGAQDREEGCLSVPGFYEPVRRAEHIRVAALDRNGRHFELDADGLLAVCIQHERDHLDGTLFVDYLSKLKRQRIKSRLKKLPRSNGRNGR